MRFTFWRGLAVVLIACPLAFVLACGGDDGTGGAETPTRTPTLDPEGKLKAQLEAALLTTDDVPAGLQAAGLSYYTNQDLASSAANPDAELKRLNQLGRLLAVDENFVPIGELPPDEPVKGGIQHSVSFYLTAEGASQAVEEKIALARSADWTSAYPDLSGVGVRLLERKLGDESAWFRITGTAQSGELGVDDQIIFRVDRAWVFLRVFSLFPAGSGEDVFIDLVAAWAHRAADLALAALSGTSPSPAA
jgi:hypothetical protein